MRSSSGTPGALLSRSRWRSNFPKLVRGLVLASGYYYPTLRPDVVALSAPAMPVVGDVMGHTVSPIDQPNDVAAHDGEDIRTQVCACRSSRQFPKEMALRPSQIRASAAESALMISDAFHFEDKYAELKMPVVIIAGEDDRLIDVDKQSARLHSDVSQSAFHRVARNGPHDPSDGDGRGHGSDQRSGRRRFLGGSQFAKRVHDFGRAVRFSQKPAALREIAGANFDVSGSG